MNLTILKFYTVLLIFLTLSCKKKKDETPAPVNNATTTTGGNTGGTYSGTFNAEKYISWFNGISSLVSYLPKVCLTATPQPETALFVFGSNFGIVKSNNIQLKFNSAIKIYMDSTGAISYSNQINFEHNSPTFGNINFTNTDTFPRYTPALALQVQDTVRKNQNYLVPLTNLSYFNTVTANLYNPLNPGVYAAKTASVGAANITFVPTDLSVLPANTFYVLRLVLKKYNDQTINSKLFRFENDSYNDFPVYIK